MGEASSLKLLIFPKKWREGRNIESEFHAFLIRYNEFLCSRAVTCEQCNLNRTRCHLIDLEALGKFFYGAQSFTCYDCMEHFCHDGDGEHFCYGCERAYCQRQQCKKQVRHCCACRELYCADCDDFEQCIGCQGFFCHFCSSDNPQCAMCKGKFCGGECDYNNGCETCDTLTCFDCYKMGCYDCQSFRCGPCRVSECNEYVAEDDGGYQCAGCFRRAYPVLLKENSVLRRENSELKRKRKDLTGADAEEE